MSIKSVLSAAGMALAAAIALPATASAQLQMPGTVAHDWSGFYAGLSVGGASVKSKVGTTVCSGSSTTCYWTAGGSSAAADPGTITRAGNGTLSRALFSGGLQAGYNVQVQSFLVGAELDVVSLNTKMHRRGVANNANGVNGANILDSITSGPLATLRGRAGYTFGNLLVFGTGGLAIGSVERDVTYTEFGYGSRPGCTGTATGDNFCASKSSTLRPGWTAGGGMEWAFLPNWSMKAEYLYVDLGSRRTSSPLLNGNGSAAYTVGGVAQALSHNFDFRTHIGRVGVNYHF